MKKEFTGFTKIFRFTLAQHCKGRGYRSATITLGILCFLIPFAICTILAAFDSSSAPTPETVVLSTDAQTICVVNDAGLDYDFTTLTPIAGFEAFSDLQYTAASSVEAALDAADEQTLVLHLSRSEGFMLTTVLPEKTALTQEDADNFAAYISMMFRQILLDASGLDNAQLSVLDAPIQTQDIAVSDVPVEVETDAGLEDTREIMTYLIPYLNVMVLYFLVLIYGQGVSNSVIMEKTSKLMDTFLVAIRPPAMVLGKVLALCTAAITQIAVWIAALIAGIGAGCAAIRLIDPDSTMAILRIFDDLSIFTSLFSPIGMILGVLIILGGFLLYCSLAAIGGALAGKPEDLSSTNSLFSLALVASFLLSLYSSGIMSGAPNAESWLNYFPFSSIFIVPALAMLGEIPPVQVCISLALIVLCALGLMYAAGHIYKMMALYKGNPPKITKVFSMLRSR